ncbi:hypothetical protein JAAARDRAFT_172292 [Jaapia argillacea MUCL 33604]|uniref:Anaphase-promoting complex subunit 5 domain-containing protein n=1 Tax=Jaapia argillacea MUCL 33604 TaxID=933084 RepID=A0A067Q6P6_9AGAM|nr:hypothetical protein JAAARDRAFT_172292 [Jaapia argillacea MUCL 33604]
MSKEATLSSMDKKGHYVASTPDKPLLDRLCPSLLARVYTDFASYHYSRFKRKGDKNDMEKGVDYDRKALALRPIGHSHRHDSLLNLTILLRARFERWSVVDDLREVILLNREALALCPKGHPSHTRAVNSLFHSIFMSHRHSGTMHDLEEAIRHAKDALALSPIGNRHRISSLSNLAVSLSWLYLKTGQREDLEQSIKYTREIISLRKTNLGPHYTNLAIVLQFRHSYSQDPKDLEETIKFAKLGVSLPPRRDSTLTALAIGLESRGGEDDLEESIVLYREALQLCPYGHIDHTLRLSTLAGALRRRYARTGQREDLEEAEMFERHSIAIKAFGST